MSLFVPTTVFLLLQLSATDHMRTAKQSYVSRDQSVCVTLFSACEVFIFIHFSGEFVKGETNTNTRDR